MKKLSFSILRNNRLFSVSLFLIYVMVTVILVMLTFFYPSVETSVDSFIENYGLPDATLVTRTSLSAAVSLTEQIPGIEVTDAVIIAEGKTELPTGDVITLRYSSIPQSGRCSYYNTVSGENVQLNEQSVLISSKFAEKNGISAGDSLLVSAYGRSFSLTVTDVVSCPDTIYVARDVNSWFDDTQYGFVYVSGTLLNSCLGIKGMANAFYLWCAEGADTEAVLAETVDLFEQSGITVISATAAEDSTVYYQIHNSLDGTKAVVTYLPVFIFIIGILFCGFFIYQIICSSRRTVGILQACGMGTGRICGVFIRYSLLLCTPALILGFGIGFSVLSVFLNIYKDIFVLPELVWSGNALLLILVVLAVYAIGILSCAVCVRAISSVDPVSVLAGSGVSGASAPPALIGRLRLGAFDKITVSSLLRNKKRMAVMALCNIACFLLTFLSLSVLSSKLSGMNFMFEERFDYDYIVITEDSGTMDEAAALDCVEKSERVASAVYSYDGEYMRLEALPANPSLTVVKDADGSVLSIPEDGIILEEGFARRHKLSVGDTVQVGGLGLKVTAISREYFYSTQYISLKTAELLDAQVSDALYVRLENNADEGSFKKQLGAMDGVACFYAVSERRTSAADSMRAMDAPCYLFAVLGILIGIVIVSNMNIHSVRRRKKEFATLKVLGTGAGELRSMFLLEAFAGYAVSLPPGLLVSFPLAGWILEKMSSMSMEFVLVHPFMLALASAAAMLLYLLLSIIPAMKTAESLPLTEILAKNE